MAPIYKRKTSFGGIPVEPEQAYVQPTAPSVTLTDVETKAIIGNTAVIGTTSTEKPRPLLCYRDVLALSRQDVADIFYRVVSGKVKTPILGDPSAVEVQVVELKARIKEVQELIGTRNRRWQKHHRPDDMLTTAELQRLLRQDESELKRLQEQVRGLQQRLHTWGKNKEDFVGATEEWVSMLFLEKHPNIFLSETTPVYGWFPFAETKRVRNAKGGFDLVDVTDYDAGAFQVDFDKRYCIDNYRRLISLGPGALEVTSDGMTWEKWAQWENAAILVAITEGLIQANMDVISRYPGLNRWVVPEYDKHAETDDRERKQIAQTGGASLGGAAIYARGWRYGKGGGWTRRALESFDATARLRRSDSDVDFDGYSDTGPSTNYRRDDVESYDPR